MYLVLCAAILLVRMAHLEAANTERGNIAQSTEKMTDAQQKQSGEGERTTADADVADNTDAVNDANKNRPWKSEGVDLIINTFKFDLGYYTSGSPGSRERINSSFMSVSSVGIRGYHGRKSIGFSIGNPFTAGALQVPDSGAFHLGYQLGDNWQAGLLAFIDFSMKDYHEDSGLLDTDDHQSRTAGYTSMAMSTALGGWLDWQVLDWWHLQLAVYQVRSVMKSSLVRSYGDFGNDQEITSSGVEYTRINFSLSRHFKLAPKVEFAPRILIGFNTLYNHNNQSEEVNGKREELDFEDSSGVFMSVTLGSFIYHL